jgi:hypothetical protein
MSQFMTRPWFEDGEYRNTLQEKIKNGWFIKFVHDGDITPTKVIQIIYAGYKVELPNKEIVTVNPNQKKIEDFESKDAYEQALGPWKEEADRKAEIRRQELLAAQVIIDAKLENQRNCLHDNVKTYCVVRAAGCDIYDTACVDCEKELRRSWSTAYDRDPDDVITDWDWWVRYYRKTYNAEPNPSNYQINQSSLERF